ncbi:hypothetical protein D3C87_651020 [compost metagenome]
MANPDLTVTKTPDALRGTRPLGLRFLGTRPLGDSVAEEEPGRVSPAMAGKIRALIAKLRSLLSMVPPELRGKIMGLIASAEGALAGFWMGDLNSLVSLMERTVQLLNQLAGWGDLRDLRALATRMYWDRRRILSELQHLLAGAETRSVDSLKTQREPDPIGSLAAMIDSRF